MSNRGEVAYLRRSLAMAQRRLAAIHFATSRGGDDPRLRAKAEGLTMQIAALELELREAQG